MSIAARQRGRRIDEWPVEDPAFWNEQGAGIARRNLIFSIFAEHVGFSVWSLWSVLVLFLGPAYHIDPAGKFVLTAVPTAVGAVLRLPYTFAVVKFGGRNWTIISAALLLIPAVAAALAIKPGVPYSTLLLVAAVAGVGGGNFASSMANINAFYPQRLKGRALGLNAGGGNLGVAVIQLAGLAVLAFAGKDHPAVVAGIYIPLIVLAALCAAMFMDNLAGVRNDRRAMRDAARRAHTWILSFLYIGTFGSFIGYSFAFGQVLQVQFSHQFDTPLKAAYLTFLGPLLGSLTRPAGGWLADRFGGARVTFWSFTAMAASTAVVLIASEQASLALFITAFVLLFMFSGAGNGSVYKMIPAVFRAASQPEHEVRRMSGAVIGIAGAAGAFGGVLVNLAFRQSFLVYRTGNVAYLAFIAFYMAGMATTWVVYMRASPRRLVTV